MVVVIFFTVKGDGEELIAGYDKTVAVAHPSRLGHLMAQTSEGMTGVGSGPHGRTSSDTWPTTFPRSSSGRV